MKPANQKKKQISRAEAQDIRDWEDIRQWIDDLQQKWVKRNSKLSNARKPQTS